MGRLSLFYDKLKNTLFFFITAEDDSNLGTLGREIVAQSNAI